MTDQQNRLRMANLLRKICNDELTGWQVHDEAEKIVSDDESIDTICCILEILYGGWEESVCSLDGDTKKILDRCCFFLSTDLPLRTTVEHFRTRRKYWFDKFDTVSFLEVIKNGVWPFETKDSLDSVRDRLKPKA